MHIPVVLTVNGKRIERSVDPGLSLLRFLREELSLVGTKNGCEVGHCGACTIIIDGAAKRACLIKMSRADGLNIETIEALAPAGGQDLHPIQRAFLEEGAVQCGFCSPGMVLATKALLDKNPTPTIEDVKKALKDNLCRCTGYAAIERAVFSAARALRAEPAPALEHNSGVGAPAIRKDGPAKVRGEPIFAEDLPADAPLIGKLLFSELAHARIISIDALEARNSPGVELVLTGADIPGPNTFGLFVSQQPVIARTEAKYLGEVVAAVFARSREEAEAARDKIRVVYEALPAQLDAEANIDPDAPLIHTDTKNNILHHVSVRKGDAAKGFAAADIVVEGVYETPAVEHAYLEPESCLAAPDGKGGVVVWTGNQGSEEYREMIAENIGLSLEKVRVVLVACGGAFGGKEEPAGQIHAALAAKISGKPIRIVLTREESIRISTKRHPMKIWMKHGATKDGHLLAMTSKVIADAGAYVSESKPVIFRSAVTASGPYEVDSVEADSYGVYTHKNPSGAFRGFGSTQACFAAEIQMDKLARSLGLPAAELRRRNGFRPGSTTSTGQVLKDGVGYLATLEAAERALEAMKREFAASSRPDNIKVGFGIASSYKNVGIGTGISDHAGAIVELLPSGRILVNTGAADIGQGSDTISAQITAEVLGVPYALIDVAACDTATSPDGGMTTGSRQTFVTGNAVRIAGERLAAALKPFRATNGTPSQAVLADVYRAAKAADAETKVEYTYVPPKTYPHRTDANPDPARKPEEYDIHYAYCFASAAVAVEVDTETGAVKVLRIAAAQDVGKIINPLNVRGQVEGSVAMGVGYALTEEFLETDSEIVTNTLKKLGVPRIGDVPPIETIVVEEPQPEGPFGAKGFGEVGVNTIAPAISNAVFDAVGVRMQSLPIKKEKILAALKSKT